MQKIRGDLFGQVFVGEAHFQEHEQDASFSTSSFLPVIFGQLGGANFAIRLRAEVRDAAHELCQRGKGHLVGRRFLPMSESS